MATGTHAKKRAKAKHKHTLAHRPKAPVRHPASAGMRTAQAVSPEEGGAAIASAVVEALSFDGVEVGADEDTRPTRPMLGLAPLAVEAHDGGASKSHGMFASMTDKLTHGAFADRVASFTSAVASLLPKPVAHLIMPDSIARPRTGA